MAEPVLPDKAAVRRAFARAAATYDAHAVLQREVGERLLANLAPMRVEPHVVLDLGCGTGASLATLAQRHPGARLVALDVALPMLERARERTPAWRRMLGLRRPQLLCADAESLPLAGGAVQVVYSNLALQWTDPARVFAEVSRVLAPGGVFAFSTFGPDTLRELREAFASVDGAAHVNTFVDMHDLGDLLVHAGLAEPVMEMEVMTLEYDSVEAGARDLQGLGARHALPGRPRGLGGRARWKQVQAHYERRRRPDGALPATYEVVYGHAWKVAPRVRDDGRQVIEFRPRMKP